MSNLNWLEEFDRANDKPLSHYQLAFIKTQGLERDIEDLDKLNKMYQNRKKGIKRKLKELNSFNDVID